MSCFFLFVIFNGNTKAGLFGSETLQKRETASRGQRGALPRNLARNRSKSLKSCVSAAITPLRWSSMSPVSLFSLRHCLRNDEARDVPEKTALFVGEFFPVLFSLICTDDDPLLPPADRREGGGAIIHAFAFIVFTPGSEFMHNSCIQSVTHCIHHVGVGRASAHRFFLETGAGYFA